MSKLILGIILIIVGIVFFSLPSGKNSGSDKDSGSELLNKISKPAGTVLVVCGAILLLLKLIHIFD